MADQDNRETEKKLIDLFFNIKNTLEDDPAIIDTIWFDSVTTLHDEISFWIDDFQRGKIKGEVTTDSGADVCEWERADLPENAMFKDVAFIACNGTNHLGNIMGWKVCPYCTKPITIKGE